MWEKSTPGRGKSPCKCPEAEDCMLYWSCSKGACMAGVRRPVWSYVRAGERSRWRKEKDYWEQDPGSCVGLSAAERNLSLSKREAFWEEWDDLFFIFIESLYLLLSPKNHWMYFRSMSLQIVNPCDYFKYFVLIWICCFPFLIISLSNRADRSRNAKI